MADVTVIGLGFVGLTTAAFFANRGANVHGIDNNIERNELLTQMKIPFFEPKLGEYVKKAFLTKRLTVGDDIQDGTKLSRYLFICVGTPMTLEGKVDLTSITKVSKDIGRALKTIDNYKIVCVKSTVPPKTTENLIAAKIEQESSKERYKDFGITFIPEFLSEGSAINDIAKPHKNVIGANDPKSLLSIDNLMRRIYRRQITTIKTNIISAELIKYANNAFLATKISYINTIANICNTLPGADVDVIARALGLDPRIGNQFLVAGPGYGGSCLPKDLSGFILSCRETGYEPILLKAVEEVNADQLDVIINIVKERLGTLSGKTISILGTAFKKNTDDIRESASIHLIRKLKNLANIRIHDPKALENTRKIFGDSIKYSHTIRDLVTDSHCLIIMTDWDEYRGITETKLLEYNKNRPLLIVDTRRLLKIKKSNRIDYVGLGKSE